MSSSKPNLRSSSSFPNLLLSCLSLTLFILSAASVGPTLLIRVPPTVAGAALLAVSAASLASAAAGACAALTRCRISHTAFTAAALAGQVAAALALFHWEGPALARLGSRRDPREGRLLARVECGVMTAMAILQAAALLLTCAVQACWIRDHRRMEADVDAARRVVGGRRVADAGEEVQLGKKKTDNNNNNHAQWVKTDFKG